jgi:pimeloyl-ACP methyl ester carboxylesterase
VIAVPYAQVGSLTIHYQTAGSGTPLVLLHGLGSSSRSWRQQLDGLKEHYQVIAWDAPGYGKSSDPDPEFRTFAELADMLKGFLDSLGFRRIFLLGHSMGSTLAIQFCTMYPQYVEALILASSTRGGKAHPETNERKLKNRLHMIENLPPTELARQRTPQMLSPFASAELRHEVESIMAEVRPAGYRSVAYSLYHADQTPLLSAITVPTLVICGEEDVITPVAESRIVREGIAGAELVLIPRAGHLCYLEQPQLFNTHVHTFCQRYVPSSQREDVR